MNIEKIIKKIFNRETILYSFFGFMTFLVGAWIFQGLLYLGINYKISNIFSLVLGKLFAYICNKLIVFRCKNKNLIEFCKEFARFVVARGLTALIDYFGVIFAVEMLHWNEIMSKYIFMTVVVIINYFFGKKLVFRQSAQTE
ncbi:MAG: GtrA family protein [Lachnospiraceae bacterium]|nr:GtrA family protein [Lachnospiraceae bacterium]